MNRTYNIYFENVIEGSQYNNNIFSMFFFVQLLANKNNEFIFIFNKNENARTRNKIIFFALSNVKDVQVKYI